MTPRHRLVLVLLPVLALLACLGLTAPARASARTTGIQHVVWIWEENHNYASIIGSPSAPYINSLAQRYGTATNAWAISHPSAPNYIGATSGLPLSQLPASDCTSCVKPGPDIFTQGETWKAYQESMPVPCDGASAGPYVVRHNPAHYFTDIGATACKANDVPLTAFSTTLPAFTFITPNLNDDMHDGTIMQADNWLKAHLAPILNSADYTSGSTVIFVMWDEGGGGGAYKGIDCTNTTNTTCHVPLIVISPYVSGRSSSLKVTHYSVLKATEDLLGRPELGRAASAPSLLAAFGL